MQSKRNTTQLAKCRNKMRQTDFRKNASRARANTLKDVHARRLGHMITGYQLLVARVVGFFLRLEAMVRGADFISLSFARVYASYASVVIPSRGTGPLAMLGPVESRIATDLASAACRRFSPASPRSRTGGLWSRFALPMGSRDHADCRSKLLSGRTGLKSLGALEGFIETSGGPASGESPSACADAITGDSQPIVALVVLLPPGDGGTVVTCRVCMP